VIGLGNPGNKYLKTRHNIGFRVVDSLRNKYTVVSGLKKKTYLAWEIELDGSTIFIIKPRTFMNECGKPIKRIIEDFGICPEEILVVYDDVHLPFGQIRVRRKGSSGGHNGIKSIIEELKTLNFPRIKIGIGRENIDNLVDFVLSGFSRKEESQIKPVCESAVMAVKDIIKEGLDKAMARYN
jgi:PTH1 family peptidyl-tRNA hydrolase